MPTSLRRAHPDSVTKGERARPRGQQRPRMGIARSFQAIAKFNVAAPGGRAHSGRECQDPSLFRRLMVADAPSARIIAGISSALEKPDFLELMCFLGKQEYEDRAMAGELERSGKR